MGSAACIGEERVIVVEEIADHPAERFQQERGQRSQLLAAEVRTLRTAFENLTAAFSRVDGASAGVVELPNPLRRVN